MNKTFDLFTNTKPTRLFFTVALPGMISMLAMSIYGVVEGIFIGQLLGEAAFAAVNIAFPFIMINFSLTDMIAVGSSVHISVALGRRDEKKANNIFTCSILMIVFCAFVTGLIFFFGSPFLMELMGIEGDLAVLAVKYIRVYAALGPLITMAFATDNYLKVSGFVKGSMFLNIFMSLLTIGFLYLFVGVLEMEVEGAALASSLAMLICASIAFVPFVFKKAQLKFTAPKLSFSIIKGVFSCGAPIFFSNIAGRVAAIIMNMALIKVGGQTAVAAYAVLMYAAEIIQPMLYGMTDSVQPAIGYNWGAGKLERVRDIGKCAIAACAVVSFAGVAVMFFFPEQIASMFVKPEEIELFNMASAAMKIFCIAFLFRWFGFAVQGFFSAIEKPLPATALSIASAMVFPIVFVYALSFMGLDGLWLNLAATSLAVSVMAFFMMLFIQKKMKKDIQIIK